MARAVDARMSLLLTRLHPSGSLREDWLISLERQCVFIIMISGRWHLIPELSVIRGQMRFSLVICHAQFKVWLGVITDGSPWRTAGLLLFKSYCLSTLKPFYKGLNLNSALCEHSPSTQEEEWGKVIFRAVGFTTAARLTTSNPVTYTKLIPLQSQISYQSPIGAKTPRSQSRATQALRMWPWTWKTTVTLREVWLFCFHTKIQCVRWI